MRHKYQMGGLAAALGNQPVGRALLNPSGPPNLQQVGTLQQSTPQQALADSAEAARASLREARARILQRPSHDPSLKWLRLAGALGRPTRTGSFGETMGFAADALAQDRAHQLQSERLRDDQVLAYDKALADIDRRLAQDRTRIQKPFQFGAQTTFKDEKGNLFFGTQKRNPQTGEVESVLSAVDGTDIQPEGQIDETGAYGLTALEKVSQLRSETSAANRAKEQEKQRSGYIASGLTAREMMPNTKRLIELTDLIRTGRTAQAQKFFGDVFGVTDPNLGEFNSRAGQMVLGNIRQLGANPTEGERAFLQDISVSIGQGGEVNKAILNDLLRVQERQVNRAKWFASNPGATIEEYLLATDEEDFVPSSDKPEGSPDEGLEIQRLREDLGL